MKIGELAKLTGVQVETIRHYEREGLLPQTMRSEGNYRIYDTLHGQRLSFIRHCRSLDMTLEEIRVLLCLRDAPTASCDEVNALLDNHIGHVTHRVNELQQLKKQLIGLRKLCQNANDVQHCGIINELNLMSKQTTTSTKVIGHVSSTHSNIGPNKPQI